MVELTLIIFVLLGIPAILCYLGDLLDKRRKEPVMAGVFIIIVGLALLIGLFAFGLSIVEEGFVFKNLYYSLLIPLGMIALIFLVTTFWVLPDLVSGVWKSIESKFNKNS